jgi:RHS repeat-associated protein
VSGRDGAAQGEQQFRYDAVGNPTEAIDELGHSLRTAFDDYDRPIMSDPPDQGPTSTTYSVAWHSWVATTRSPTGEVFSTSTDAMGRQVRACGADGICIEDVYSDGLLVRRNRLGAGTLAPVLGTRHYQYHPASARPWREWDWITLAESRLCAGTVPDGCELPRVEHTYTPAGRPATFRDRQGNLTTYSYDTANGSLLLTGVSRDGLPGQAYGYDTTYPILARRSLIDPTGDTAVITEDTEWDRNLRPAAIVRAKGGRRETIELRYDAAGRQTLAQFIQRGGTVAVRETFDPRGRPLSRAYRIATNQGSHAGTLGFTWRDNGQIASVTYPSGNRVTYDYEKSTGRLQSIVAGGAAVFEARKFDASGRALSLRLDGGAIEVTRAYDSAGREQERSIKGIASDVRRETYAYDSHGRLRTITAIEGGAVTSTVYGYDPRDRLISETHTARSGATRSFNYGYDPVTGLRISKSASDGVTTTTTDYSYTAGNRLASVDATPIPWDGYGRQAGDAQGHTFRWGLADQLLAIEAGGANLETNWHDAAGLRVARSSAAGMEYFLAGTGGGLLARAGGDAARTVDYVRLPGGAVVATVDQNGAVTPVLNSITGSPYRIGELSAKDFLYEDASGFGETINADGSLDEPLGFHQMLGSAGEGILIAGVRAYDVSTGRFLSADPLELAAAPSAIDAADFFRYAQDNPIAMHDAMGLAPCLMTLEGGCRSNIGEQTYEEQRQAHMAHYAANEPEMRALQAKANEYWAAKEANRQEAVTGSSDGQVAEAARSTDARAPSQMEAPTEPATKVERSAEQRGHSSEAAIGWAVGSTPPDGNRQDDVLEVVVYGSKKAERAAKRRARRQEGAAGTESPLLDRLGQQVFVDLLGLDRDFVVRRQKAGRRILQNRVDEILAAPAAMAAVALCMTDEQCLRQLPANLVQGTVQSVLDAAGTPFSVLDFIDAQLDADATVDELVSAHENLRTSVLATEELMLAAVATAAKAGKLGLGRGPCSFDGSTLVQTDKGFVPIRDVAPGRHRVWSRDKQTGRMAFKPVIERYSNAYPDMVHVTVLNPKTGTRQTIRSNRIHSFFVTGDAARGLLVTNASRQNAQHEGQWIQAQDLQPGQRLLNADRDWSRVFSIRIEAKPFVAYNLNVSDFHTYFVKGPGASRAGAVWVDNCSNNHQQRALRNLMEQETQVLRDWIMEKHDIVLEPVPRGGWRWGVPQGWWDRIERGSVGYEIQRRVQAVARARTMHQQGYSAERIIHDLGQFGVGERLLANIRAILE